MSNDTYLVLHGRATAPQATLLADLYAVWGRHWPGTLPTLVVVPDQAPLPIDGDGAVQFWHASTVGLRLQAGQIAAGPVDSAVLREEPGARP